MERLITYLRIRGMQRGVLGSSRAWLGVWAGLTLVRLVGRVLSQPAEVDQVRLRPGEAIEIRDTGVTWREERKNQKQERKRQKRDRKRARRERRRAR